MNEWRKAHREVIDETLSFLNSKTDGFILKGGTALLTCYGLDRFSEDIDFDGRQRDIIPLVEALCAENGYSFRVAKDTETVKRAMIHYGNESKPLKVEVSFRRANIPDDETTKINGIAVYNIDPLCMMKVGAYLNRDKIRDLYHVTFICNNYYDKLSPQTIFFLRNAIENKGIEQFDYIVRQNTDELIDTAKLADDFLNMYDKLGLLYDRHEKKVIDSILLSRESK